MKWINKTLIPYYYSHLLSLLSGWVGAILINYKHPILGSLLVASAILQLVGIYAKKPRIRLSGLIIMNMIWGVSVYHFFAGNHVPIKLSYHFPLFALLLGLGVGLRGRFGGGR